MADRFKYSEIRQKIINSIRTDLIGPSEEEEVLEENPRYAYLVGMLDVQSRDDNYSDSSEQEIDADIAINKEENFSAGKEDEETEPTVTTHFQLPASIGICFYIQSNLSAINIDVSWGDYSQSTKNFKGKDGKEYDKNIYIRKPVNETLRINFSEFSRTKDYHLRCDSNVHVYISRIELKGGFSLVTAYVLNKRSHKSNITDGIMFQVKIKAYTEDGSAAFIAKNKCRESYDEDSFYYEKKPIFGYGRGCAAVWDPPVNGRTTSVSSSFIPEYEVPGVSSELDGFDRYFFSTQTMSEKKNKEETIDKLNTLADSYEKWINKILLDNSMMKRADFKEKIGNTVIKRCQNALHRIRNGIRVIKTDETSFEAFCFMNKVIFLQNSIKKYAKKHGDGIKCKLQDFTNLDNADNNFGWRPFQIAFILMNLAGIVDPKNEEREIVDLLYFPTGGGKTEAYLGLIAFVIANRRLRAKENGKFNLDGGVSVIVRYTLRLLTTQQRDRITKMVVAAEKLRREEYKNLGKEPISIGFWVGSKVTPNKFDEFKEKESNPQGARNAKIRVYKQLLTCPFCGKKLEEENFNIDIERKSIEIYCSDKDCMFFNSKKNRIQIPVYMVDEEIYDKCPTIILSTVDKFARLPWDVNTNALFGRVDRKCSRHGYVAIGVEHKNRHNKTNTLPASTLTNIRPFLPPELIIQDELHLITGPLGTIYGAYETIIEEMCTYDGIKPKYVVSTATIKNAEAQIKCLYARKNTSQFPPKGIEIADSFFIKEIPVDKEPFRKYVGVCAQGQSMKTALLRLYAIILQTTYTYSLEEDYKSVIDPYYSLVGYFNSIRELGGAVRLIQDDIKERIKRIKKRYGQEKIRNLFYNEEITSRMSSSKIPEKLSKLEIPCTSKDCLDTAIATNMIAVGMDVDRLGLMVVTGQPKQNSEYIQATSRIGRAFPGLVVTLYNAYRPRDLSHYENFTGYHSQLYRFVEGTTATPFSARARDRVLHALIISALRLNYPNMADNSGAAEIVNLSAEQLASIKKIIIDRLNIIKPSAKADAEKEIEQFIDWWKLRAVQKKPLLYSIENTKKHNRLMHAYDRSHNEDEKATLQSMREVESATKMFYYTEE